MNLPLESPATPRLAHQLARVRTLMLDGVARTLGDIEAELGYPQASISARLRDLRRKENGEFIVDRKHIKNGLWSYRVAGKVVRDYIQLELT